jgi:hypothetical protein
VTDPEPAPSADELIVIVDETAALIVPVDWLIQLLGNVTVFGAPITADRPAPVTDRTVMVTVEPFAKAFAPPCVRSMAMSAVFCVATPQSTLPKASACRVTGVTPSPSAATSSAVAIDDSTSDATHVSATARANLVPVNLFTVLSPSRGWMIPGARTESGLGTHCLGSGPREVRYGIRTIPETDTDRRVRIRMTLLTRPHPSPPCARPGARFGGDQLQRHR